MDLQERIIKAEKARWGDFLSHPLNPKYHPDEQRALVTSLMEDIGMVGALLAWKSERFKGKWACLDAHLRKDIAPDYKGWVLYTDLTDREADLLVALYDESGRLAEVNLDNLEELKMLFVNDEAFSEIEVFSLAFENMTLRALANGGGDPQDPNVKPQVGPNIKSERYIEIFCSNEAFELIEKKLLALEKIDGVSVNFS